MISSGTPQQPGIIYLTMQELFERIDELQSEKVTEITLSYLEIYNETIRDLLVPGTPLSKQGLMLREDANHTVSVAGLSSHRPQNVDEVMEMITRGNEARTQSPTDANATSSRSHAVLQINISQRDRDAAVTEPTTMASLSIIDLAGSERASATNNRGARLLEGANINKSLLALGSCINALCDQFKKNHIPYRNSKLTRLLKFSLGGNCKTVMIVCVSPSSVHFDETQNTLRYANRAKNIQTKVVRNVYNVDRHVKDYLKKIDEQMARINELQAQQKEYESLALGKFKKLEEKRALSARENLLRIRAAYDNATAERLERTNNMKRLRHVEKRISLITAWIDGFDKLCEEREDEEAMSSLVSMRQTAQGILTELETSRQHFHQRIAKNNWDRGINSALQNGIKQIQDVDVTNTLETAEAAGLKREVEVMKVNADREAYTALLDQDKLGDANLVQVLLHAHFETITILGQIMQMSEEDAVKAAKDILNKLLTSCIEATAQVIRPDGVLNIVQAVPPTKAGTPRKTRPISLIPPSPIVTKLRVDTLQIPETYLSPVNTQSPLKASPLRRVLGSARRSVIIKASPRRKSPTKLLNKRVVRWRDDTDDGKLTEIQHFTPRLSDLTPDSTMIDESLQAPSSVINAVNDDDENDSESSPTPEIPQLSYDLKAKPGRFEQGFLANKQQQQSPTVRTSTLGLHQQLPLQEIPGNSIKIRSPLSQCHSNFEKEDQNQSSLTVFTETSDPLAKSWTQDPETARRISSVLSSKQKRQSSASSNHSSSSNGMRRSESLSRRRSPNPSSPSNDTSSPHDTLNQTDGLFTASHAKRMVKSDKKNGEEWANSILSPRTAPVTKPSVNINSNSLTTLNNGSARRITIMPGADGNVNRESEAPREFKVRMSLAPRPGQKAAWR